MYCFNFRRWRTVLVSGCTFYFFSFSLRCPCSSWTGTMANKGRQCSLNTYKGDNQIPLVLISDIGLNNSLTVNDAGNVQLLMEIFLVDFFALFHELSVPCSCWAHCYKLILVELSLHWIFIYASSIKKSWHVMNLSFFLPFFMQCYSLQS